MSLISNHCQGWKDGQKHVTMGLHSRAGTPALLVTMVAGEMHFPLLFTFYDLLSMDGNFSDTIETEMETLANLLSD